MRKIIYLSRLGQTNFPMSWRGLVGPTAGLQQARPWLLSGRQLAGSRPCPPAGVRSVERDLVAHFGYEDFAMSVVAHGSGQG